MDDEHNLDYWLLRWEVSRPDRGQRRREIDMLRISAFILPHLGLKPVTLLVRRDVLDWARVLQHQEGLAPSQVYASLQMLQAALDLAVDAGVIATNPARKPER